LPATPDLIRLESMQGLRRYHISCAGTHIRQRQGRPRNTPTWPNPSNQTLQHQIIMQVQRCTLSSQFFTAWLLTTYVHVMHGWGWQWGKHRGRKADWPCFWRPMAGTTLTCRMHFYLQ